MIDISDALEEEDRSAQSRARVLVFMLCTVVALVCVLLYIRLNAPPVHYPDRWIVNTMHGGVTETRSMTLAQIEAYLE